MESPTGQEVPLSLRYDARLGRTVNWIDVDMVRLGQSLAEQPEALPAIRKQLGKSGLLEINIYDGTKPKVLGKHLQGEASLLKRKREGLPPAHIHVYLGSIIRNCTEDWEQSNGGRVEDNLTEEILQQLGRFASETTAINQLGVRGNVRKNRAEIKATRHSLIHKSLMEKVTPRQAFKAGVINLGSMTAAGVSAELIASMAPGGTVGETLLGAATGLYVFANARRLSRQRDEDMQALDDIYRQSKQIVRERRFGESYLRAQARARQKVLKMGSFCVVDFRRAQEEEVVAPEAESVTI